MMDNEAVIPETKLWQLMTLVRISDVPGFGEWLHGQTLPYVEDDPTPTDWAFSSDWVRFVSGLPVID